MSSFRTFFKKILGLECSEQTTGKIKDNLPKIVLSGTPNVGKSVLFNQLTKSRVTVSNYPGTTVDIARGICGIGETKYEVIDTPGIYSLFCITDEERVSRELMLNNSTQLIINVIDAKNIERMLPFTLQLIEAGLSVILVLNIMDEAENLGITFDLKKLEHKMNIPVVAAVAITGRGVNDLKHRINEYLHTEHIKMSYGTKIDNYIKKIELLLKNNYAMSKNAVALLAIQQDEEILAVLAGKEKATYNEIKILIDKLSIEFQEPLNYIINIKRREYVKGIIAETTKQCNKTKRNSLSETLSRITMNPITGFPILLLIVYFGLYKFVGEVGAGILVDYIETDIFEKIINPYVTSLFEKIIPWTTLQDLFVHKYGIITLGIRYAIAIILPIVGTFFLVFATIEDSGYLPRLAMLLDKIFKKIGLSGRAIIPMVLGLGCDTMATMVTRILPTRRERFISTFLLALAVPCSAQLGVLLGIFDGKFLEFSVWFGIIVFVFLASGTILSKFVPGEKPVFFMELPPLRIPKLSNILIKTYTRMEWYFKEVVPLFIFASVFIWLGKLTGLFDLILKLLSYPLQLVGLPQSTAVVYLFGFFRRDYGAAGLYDLQKTGALTDNQLVVSAVILTLFIPCIAQLLMNIKERGCKTGFLMSGFVFVFAFFVGGIVNLIFNLFGIVL